MSRYVRKWNFINEYHIAGIESWLSDQSAKGYFIKKPGRTISVFEKNTPKRLQYRLEPFGTDTSIPSPERLELYAQDGWNYIAKYQRLFLLFSSEKETPPEIHTDPQIQSLSLQTLQQRLRTETILLSFLLLGAIAMLLACIFLNTPTLSMIRNSFLSQSILLLLDLTLIVQGMRNCHYVTRLTKQLASGIPMKHQSPYHREYNLTRFGNLLVLLALLLLIAVPILTSTKQWNRPINTDPNNHSYPLLSQLEGPQFEYEKPFLYNGTYYENSITHHWSPLAPTQYQISQTGTIPTQKWTPQSPPTSPDYNPSLYIEVYQLTFSFMAPSLTNDLITRHARNLLPTPSPTSPNTTPSTTTTNTANIPNSPYDSITTYQKDTATLFFATKNRTVIFARYNGLQDPLPLLQNATYLLP